MYKPVPVRPLSRGRDTYSYHLYTGLRALPSTCAYLTRTPTGVLPPIQTTLQPAWPTSERSLLNRHRSKGQSPARPVYNEISPTFTTPAEGSDNPQLML